MDRYRDLLLQVWREASRHIRIAESARDLERILTGVLPLDGLFVLELDARTGALALRAGVPETEAPGRFLLHRTPGASERRELRRWIASGEVLAHRGGDALAGPLRLVCRPPIRGSWLAAPLREDGRPAGVLLLALRRPKEKVAPHHLGLAEALVEPFAVALGNDRRVRELDARRAAAEEETRYALRRMGREDLSDVIVGENAGLQPVMERVRLVATSDIPVLIFGETGSGKEVIARAIHNQSRRGRAPFVRVNCAAISPELIDSELFGHEKGAFTGATSLRRGWFERADQGTLLLDEIGELPLPAQVRLLRVLQEGTFERVGGERPVRVDVRIVAATHADLPGMVQHGHFREDLWYRITGFQIILPSLRERKEDIPDLARHFLARASHRFGVRPLDPTPEDLALLAAYDWPGNVRELASVMDRAAILGAGETLEIAKALGGTGGPGRGPLRGRPVEQAGARVLVRLQTLDESIRAHIETALAVTRGRIEGKHGAARLLGVNPHTLRARMRRMGIDWARFREA